MSLRNRLRCKQKLAHCRSLRNCSKLLCSETRRTVPPRRKELNSTKFAAPAVRAPAMRPKPKASVAGKSALVAVTAEQIDRAAHLLQAGSLVAFPTETVYGLGGDA